MFKHKNYYCGLSLGSTISVLFVDMFMMYNYVVQHFNILLYYIYLRQYKQQSL